MAIMEFVLLDGFNCSFFSANICELTGGETTLKQKGSQVRTRSSKQVDMGFSNESAEKGLFLNIIEAQYWQ